VGGNLAILPLSSHVQWPIQPHSSLKQHVNVIKFYKTRKFKSENSAHDCQKAFSFRGLRSPDYLTRGSAPDPRCRLALKLRGFDKITRTFYTKVGVINSLGFRGCGIKTKLAVVLSCDEACVELYFSLTSN